jgi:hypothetical protein
MLFRGYLPIMSGWSIALYVEPLVHRALDRFSGKQPMTTPQVRATPGRRTRRAGLWSQSGMALRRGARTTAACRSFDHAARS